VTGGAGHIGSAVTERRLERELAVVAYDSHLTGHRDTVAAEATFVKGDLLDQRHPWTYSGDLESMRLDAMVVVTV
jgi:UDP-glucose 4-epimerase